MLLAHKTTRALHLPIHSHNLQVALARSEAVGARNRPGGPILVARKVRHRCLQIWRRDLQRRGMCRQELPVARAVQPHGVAPEDVRDVLAAEAELVARLLQRTQRLESNQRWGHDLVVRIPAAAAAPPRQRRST